MSFYPPHPIFAAPCPTIDHQPWTIPHPRCLPFCFPPKSSPSAKAYIDEINAYLNENDGWNADGTLGGREFNLVPFSDFSYRDSSGNKWGGYTPKNSPYKVLRL